MNVQEKSDCAVVPVNQPNNEGYPSAEAGEGRAQTKENIVQSHMRPTQSGERMSQGLDGVRKAARERKQERFTALLHHLTVDLLRDSFYALKPKAAPGVDGVTWEEYESGLEDRLVDLHNRVHRGTYRALPSRRVYIPKADGRQRPLGIAALEDKIVQQAVVTILNQIYEVDFKGFSYGFRPGRSPHQALDALTVGIQRQRVNWVLDADIRGFFDNLSHEWMLKFVKHRVADHRILRLIQKWLRAGVSEDGQWSETKVGTPQGAVASPLLANVYLHYVFDLWVEAWRKKAVRGDVIVVRYADDLVVGFEHRIEAERFLEEFRERLAKFGLELHADKTRLIEFGRFAARTRQRRGKGKPETFTFLGLTHFCGQLTTGSIIVRLRSEPGCGRLYWDTTNIMLFPVTRVSYVCSCIAFAGCGGVFWSVAVNAQGCDGIASILSWTDGFPNPVFYILIPMRALPPCIPSKSRMRQRARTDLCGGRREIDVPTATKCPETRICGFLLKSNRPIRKTMRYFRESISV
jgi:RNA-directed DNA polymerase